jgi:trimeric autotransporter adhesin
LRAKALLNNVDGGFNTAIGHSALVSNANGSYNTANGYNALRLNITGSDNTAIGDGALFNNSSGGQNTALGENAGFSQTTGSGNVYIGSGITGVAGESNACYIASIFNQTSPNGAQVLINADNKLGTSTSSKRFKNDIQPMNNATQALFSLKPITFRYKKEIDPIGISQFGLVARGCRTSEF